MENKIGEEYEGIVSSVTSFIPSIEENIFVVQLSIFLKLILAFLFVVTFLKTFFTQFISYLDTNCIKISCNCLSGS